MLNTKPKKTKSKRGGYRNAASYCARTPEARQRQIDGLAKARKGRKKGYKAPQTVQKEQTASIQKMDIIEFATDILKVSFKERPAQEVILRCLYGLGLDSEQLALYKLMTDNKEEFEANIEKDEGLWDIGARGGKSLLTSIVALYEATRDKWQKYLAPGETGYAVIIATRQKQAEDIIQKACTRMLEGSNIAWMMKEAPLKASLELTNGMTIASFPCNSTAARGLPIFLLIFDEMAWYRMEGVKADYAIFNALNPRRAQFPGAKCLKITTPAGKQGLFWEEFDQGFKVPSRLTIKANTRLVNPVIPQEFVDKEYKRDPDNAKREFGAEFAETTEGFFEGCMDELKACFVLPEDVPPQTCYQYYASIDQSGLSGRDAWAFSICHQDTIKNKIVQDIARSWDTKNIAEIIVDSVKLCSMYGLGSLTADRYAGGIVESLFNNKGIEVVFRELLPAVYKNFKTLVISDKVMLQDDGRLRRGLMTTQAFYGKSQRLSIVHERTREGHSDIADATVTAVYDCSMLYSVSDYRKDAHTTTRKQDEAMCNYDVLRL